MVLAFGPRRQTTSLPPKWGGHYNQPASKI